MNNLQKNHVLNAPPFVYRYEAITPPNEKGALTFFLVTLGFCVCVALAVIGVSYAWALFANTSYKLVGAFLVLIGVSNLTCKYILWVLRH